MIRPWLGLTLILIAVVCAYSPSLRLVPRSDHIVYLYETSPYHSWFDLAFRLHDLNRWGTYAAGDERLFRPGMYFILGSEKFLLGDGWEKWQAFGVVFHLVVVGLLFRLLWLIRPGAGAFVATAFFALQFTNMEMVIFSHVNSYMVYVALMVVVLIQVYQVSVNQRHERWRILLMTGMFLMASMVYELASVAAVLTTVFLWVMRPQQWRSFLWLLCPVIIYAVMGFSKTWLGSPLSRDVVYGVFKPMGWWLWLGFFPGQVPWYFSGRNMIADTFIPGFSWSMLGDIGVWAVLFLAFVGGYRLIARVRGAVCDKTASKCLSMPRIFLPDLKMLGFALYVTSLLGALSIVIALGRGALNGVEPAIRHNVHYLYLFWSFAMVVIYALVSAYFFYPLRWNHQGSRELFKNGRDFLTKLAMIAIAVLICINAVKLYQVIDWQAKASEPTRRLLVQVRALVKAKSQEPGFFLDVPVDYPGNYRYQDKFHQDETLISMLYPRFTHKIKLHNEMTPHAETY